jgi:hypothetical protein
MVDPGAFISIAKSFDETLEQPHFDKLSYRINRKIFATLDLSNNSAVIKLTPAKQAEYCEIDDTAIYPVKGAWGKMGYTIFELNRLRKQVVISAITSAYCNTAPKKLSHKYQTNKLKSK